ncbi:hypothetical protein HDV00_006841 [Rhizophlyctis rosea]|nr:hypothetical protein HDV00_006841 [Rhizophlyctis rosea]
MTIPEVTIGAAISDTVDPGPTTPFIDGIFGLAFPYLNDNDVQPWFFEAVTQNFTKDPVFGLYYYSDPTYQNSTATGQLILGGYDPAHFEGNLTFHNVSKMYYPWNGKLPLDYGFWALQPQSYWVGPQNWTVQANVTDYWIVDSGTSWLILPTHMFQYLLEATAATYDSFTMNATVSCDLTGYPDIGIMFDGQNYTLTPQDYIELDQTQDPPNCILAATDAQTDDIWSIKAPFVLGAVFLRKFYSAYNITSKQLGFAPARRLSTDPVPPPLTPSATSGPTFIPIPGIITANAQPIPIATNDPTATSPASDAEETWKAGGVAAGPMGRAEAAVDAEARHVDFSGMPIGMFF